MPPEPDAALRVERIAPADLQRLAGAWRDLAARAASPNAFLTPSFVAASALTLRDGAGVAVLAAWRREGTAERLVGLLPVRLDAPRLILPLRLAAAMAHNYAPLGTPLLDRDHAPEAAGALLDALFSAGARVLLLPFLAEEGAAARAFAAALAKRGLRHRAFGRHRRALATPGADVALPPRRRKEIARQRRRLDEAGQLTLTRARTPAEAEPALDAFLALEAAGWKGQAARTATLQRPDRAAFMRAAVTGAAQAEGFRALVLALDGRPVAVALAFVGAGHAVFWKIAYDEAFARFSPGVQATLALTDDLLAEDGVAAIDSLAEPGHPMIDHLWHGRLAMADWLIDLVPGGGAAFALAVRLEAARRGARRLLRGALLAIGRR